MKTSWGRRWKERKESFPMNSQCPPLECWLSMPWDTRCFSTTDAGGIPVPSLQVFSRLLSCTLTQPALRKGTLSWLSVFFRTSFLLPRIVFCKDGLEVYSMKAQEGRVINSMLLSITERSSGTYKCLYEHRNEKNWPRSSVLSAPRDLRVTGHVSGSTEGTATADPNNQQASAVTAVALVTVILLLSAAAFWTVKKGTCRERCRRQQHVPSQQMEATDYGELHYATVVHYQRDKKNGKSRDTFSSHTSHSPL
ncbi:uncharacterized protein LOC125685563 isoform X2 [Lagopus muta]|uniref:uncharacterized protein LOC125685563 isoform X2 n=1 Tax=Lagopus muta TaxID=64668 RepID=UPI00209E4DAE|nr:uncharacterized protein LOC125685563 isoform X2 [Lagopus muta]